ncbi:hypothetical protein [Pseudonocardia adelaidensis]|uniref:Uncharacterized protein n=1 Tax=Pseudonocardia adelaidensis TaxID=648754 RepID=A0ABP9PBI2_9PSEU
MTIRWLLHPVTAPLALVVAGLVVAAPVAGTAGGVALLLVAGAAAGLANSGST